MDLEKKLGCIAPYIHRYIEGNNLSGYVVKPCCLYNSVIGNAESIDDIGNIEEMKIFKNQLASGEKPVECNACWYKESAGIESKRQRWLRKYSHLYTGLEDNIIDWDLRPGNLCNLKCIMCNPTNSSKWKEDQDIHFSFTGAVGKRTRELDWNDILERCKGKAARIYFAGGEPFYMKEVERFLFELSQIHWNRFNTRIEVQTNGTSLNDNLFKTLKRFRNVKIDMSIDALGKVDEYIRFPTKFKDFQTSYKKLKIFDLAFTCTVQAANFPVAYKIQEKFQEEVNFSKLVNPDFLSINALKPEVVEQVPTPYPLLEKIKQSYKYDDNLNKKMQMYLKSLEKRRGITKGHKIVPWCYV